MKILASLPIRFKITEADDISVATKNFVNAGFSVMQNHPLPDIGDEVRLTFDFKIMTVYVNRVGH
jgi:hypothetical protein